MAYTHATQAPNRQQWEANSAYSQSWNCGPTSVSFIAGFYKDGRPAIEYNRKLIAGMGPYAVTGLGKIWGCPPRTATNAWQQADMLDKRGVPSTPKAITSLSELHGLVDSGRRPVIIGLLMSRIPATIRGHSFLGMHAVVVISGGYRNGVRGFWIMDPNFPAGSSSSRRWYTDTIMRNAMPWGWAVVPDRAKSVTAPISTSIPRADYGAVTMRFRPRDMDLVLIKGKPIRNGAKVTATVVARPSVDTKVRILGELMRTGDHDPWLVYRWYMGNGHAFVYSPRVDFR